MRKKPVRMNESSFKRYIRKVILSEQAKKIDPNIPDDQTILNTTDEKTQISIARHKLVTVREKLARNPHLTARVQRILFDDLYRVIKFLLTNPSLDPRVIKYVDHPRAQLYFARSQNHIFRENLAKNPYISNYIQELLAQDEVDSVRHALMLNPSLAPHVAKNL